MEEQEFSKLKTGGSIPPNLHGAHYLAEMLCHNQSIRTLDLVTTQLGYKGLAAILNVLIHRNRTVERLYLGGNDIDAEGAKLLATLLESNPNIKALLLSVNHSCGSLLEAKK